LLNGQPVQQALAGQAGIRVLIGGTNLRSDTQVTINLIQVVSHLQDTGNTGPPNIAVELDENAVIKNSAGPLAVRARNTTPSLSDLSNEIIAGTLVGPEITKVKVKKKSSGLLMLNISGTNFPSSGEVSVMVADLQIAVQSTAFEPPDFVQAKINAAAAPSAGTTMRIRIITAQGIQSNEVTAAAK
jgi:hypothetical protein